MTRTRSIRTFRIAVIGGLLLFGLLPNSVSTFGALSGLIQSKPSYRSTDLPVEPLTSIPSTDIRKTADSVMQQHDFRSVRRRVLEDVPVERTDGGFLQKTLEAMGRAVGDFLEWILTAIFGNRRNPANTNLPDFDLTFSLGTTLLYIFLAVIILIAIWLLAGVIRVSDGQRRRKAGQFFADDDLISHLATPPGELAVSTYESRALQMAASGDYRSAVRELLIGSMSWIERSGYIRFRKGLTNRDYVRAIWKQEDRRNAYLNTSGEFERIFFGRRPATAEAFHFCLTHFQEAFREENTTTAARG